LYIYVRIQVVLHNGRPPFLCIVLFFFLGCPPLGLQLPRLAGRRKETMRNNIMCGAYMAHARKQTNDVSSDTASVCCSTVFLGATAQGYQWTVNERCCRGSQENIKKINKYKMYNNNRCIYKGII
jgi:hypothetical protein